MRRPVIALVVGGLSITSAIAGEPAVFHAEHFSDDTVVSLALAGNRAALLPGYDYDVLISISSRRVVDGSVYHDPGKHRALVKCSEPAKVSVRGVDYPVLASAPVDWKADLWRAVCMVPVL